MRPGEQFVYYRGKLSADGSLQVPHYFGTGVVGSITSSGKNFRCSIEAYQPFDKVVPFKSDGVYIESKANERPSREVGLHFQTGVRFIDQATFDRIVSAGIKPAQKKPPPQRKTTKGLKKASPTGEKVSTKVQDVAVQLALIEAEKRWPAATVFRAPAGGLFSLAIRHADGKVRHIGVKGTLADAPLVRLTDAEIQYSETHADTYSLWAFYAIDPEAGTARLCAHDGPITDDDVDIEAALHGGRIRSNRGETEVGPLPK